MLRVTDNYALVLSEAMMTGQLHLALLYDSGPIKGLTFERLLTEELLLVCAPGSVLMPRRCRSRRSRTCR